MQPLTIFYAVLGIALLSAMDAAVKWVTLADGLYNAVWLRYLFGALMVFPLLLLMRVPMPDRAGLKAHALRGLILTGTSLTFFYGISILPLAEAITLAFIAPLILPPLAAFLIGERMKGRVAVAAVAGFVGALVTVWGAPAENAAGNRTFAVISILVSATLYALQLLILRQRAQRDHAMAVAALATVVPLILLTPLALLFSAPPHLSSLPAGLLSGFFGISGILVLTWAYAKAEAQLLVVFEYTGLGFAALFGWWVFSEVPRPQIWAGAAIIAGACLYISFAERRIPKQKQSAF